MDPKRTTLLARFEQQRSRACVRGIAWELTFEEWLSIWERSGRLSQRGKHRGQYVMARNGDVGPYSVGNVFICTHSQNISDAHTGHQRKLGTGRGWTYRSAGARRYQVVISKKYIGVFATAQEAEAAYADAVEKFRHGGANFFAPQ